MNAPCKDCPDRHYLCHSTCEKYIAFDKYRQEVRERNAAEVKLKNDLWATSRHSKTYEKRRWRPYADNRGGR